jgi:hypothetical protein
MKISGKKIYRDRGLIVEVKKILYYAIGTKISLN